MGKTISNKREKNTIKSGILKINIEKVKIDVTVPSENVQEVREAIARDRYNSANR